MARATLVVPDISCEREHAITEALTSVLGIRAVRVDIPAHRVQLDSDDTTVSLDKDVALYEAEWERRGLRSRLHLSFTGCLGVCTLGNNALL